MEPLMAEIALILMSVINLRYAFSPQGDYRLFNFHRSQIRGIYEECGFKPVVTTAFWDLVLVAKPACRLASEEE